MEAMKRIAEAKATFVSRGDNSGTHQLEKKLWQEAKVNPAGAWYLSAGQGMGATLSIGSEKKGYVLTDRATFLAFKKRVQLDPLVERDRILLNIYSVLEPNAAKFPRVNAAGGKAFADFMVSQEVQDIIRTFGVDKFGEPLFFPDAGKQEESCSRPLKRAHLRRWPARALVAAYLKYASLGPSRAALHLGPFEQPAGQRNRQCLESSGQRTDPNGRLGCHGAVGHPSFDIGHYRRRMELIWQGV